MAVFDSGVFESLADKPADPWIGESLLQLAGEVALGMQRFGNQGLETVEEN
jgi:hypothetical protein